MSANMQTIQLGEITHGGIIYDVYADLINLPPVGELEPEKLEEISNMAHGTFEAHADAWKKEGISLAGKTVTVNDAGASMEGYQQTHEQLPHIQMPLSDLPIIKLWEGTKNEIVTHVSRFKTYYQTIIKAPNPDVEMQKLIKHLRTNARIKDAEILEEIKRQFLKYQAEGGEESLKEVLTHHLRRTVKGN